MGLFERLFGPGPRRDRWQEQQVTQREEKRRQTAQRLRQIGPKNLPLNYVKTMARLSPQEPETCLIFALEGERAGLFTGYLSGKLGDTPWSMAVDLEDHVFYAPSTSYTMIGDMRMIQGARLADEEFAMQYHRAMIEAMVAAHKSKRVNPGQRGHLSLAS